MASLGGKACADMMESLGSAQTRRAYRGNLAEFMKALPAELFSKYGKPGLEGHYERYEERDFERFPEYKKAIPPLTVSDEARLRADARSKQDRIDELESLRRRAERNEKKMRSMKKVFKDERDMREQITAIIGVAGDRRCAGRWEAARVSLLPGKGRLRTARYARRGQLFCRPRRVGTVCGVSLPEWRLPCRPSAGRLKAPFEKAHVLHRRMKPASPSCHAPGGCYREWGR